MNKICGIYKIVNLITGLVYIGSSENIYYRWSAHKGSLRHNRHINKRLQNAWNKYGEKAFEFVIVKIVSSKKLLKTEQYYIDKFKSYNPKYGYNKSPIAGLGRPAGWHHTEDIKKIISKYAKINAKHGKDNPLFGKPAYNHGIPHTSEHKKKLRKAWKKRKARGDVPYWTGKKRSKKTNLKISKKLRGRKISKSIVRKWVKTRMKNGYTHSAETRAKISKSNKGKKISKEARRKSSISHKKYWAKVRRLKARGN